MDTHARSVVKGVTWRILATLDTILIAFIFTKSFATALSIGGLELITKVVWYYFHERLWLRVPAANKKHPRFEEFFGHHKKMRLVSKAASWRFFGAIDTFLIALFFTGKLGVSTAIGGAELFTKIVLYYLHDRAWHHIEWGLRDESGSGGVKKTLLKEVTEKIRRHYKLNVAIVYGVLCLLFIIISAVILYSLHELVLGQ